MASPVRRRGTPKSTDQHVRTLRSTFRRGDEAIVCELGLSRDHKAYELRFTPPSNPASAATEQFDDAMSAFQRHAAIERILVHDGWRLETLDADCAVLTA